MQHHIAILTGGTSSEREIALQSAAHVQEVLASHFTIKLYDFPQDLERFLQERASIHVAIPLFHGVGGEDGTIQGFLQTLNIPFLFSGVEAQAIGMNKAVTKDLFTRCGVKTAPYQVIESSNILPLFTKPCVLKPLNTGSSVGISIANDEISYQLGIDEAFRHSKHILIEDYIPGREFTVAVIETATRLTALPVIEIKSKHAFFDLESKYDPALADEVCPAEISSELSDTLKKIAIQAHEAIGAKHLSRTDFIVDEHGVPWTLEINTIPGQTKNSLLPKAVRASGLSFSEIYRVWIEKELKK